MEVEPRLVGEKPFLLSIVRRCNVREKGDELQGCSDCWRTWNSLSPSPTACLLTPPGGFSGSPIAWGPCGGEEPSDLQTTTAAFADTDEPETELLKLTTDTEEEKLARDTEKIIEGDMEMVLAKLNEGEEKTGRLGKALPPLHDRATNDMNDEDEPFGSKMSCLTKRKGLLVRGQFLKQKRRRGAEKKVLFASPLVTNRYDYSPVLVDIDYEACSPDTPLREITISAEGLALRNRIDKDESAVFADPKATLLPIISRRVYMEENTLDETTETLIDSTHHLDWHDNPAGENEDLESEMEQEKEEVKYVKGVVNKAKIKKTEKPQNESPNTIKCIVSLPMLAPDLSVPPNCNTTQHNSTVGAAFCHRPINPFSFSEGTAYERNNPERRKDAEATPAKDRSLAAAPPSDAAPLFFWPTCNSDDTLCLPHMAGGRKKLDITLDESETAMPTVCVSVLSLNSPCASANLLPGRGPPRGSRTSINSKPVRAGRLPLNPNTQSTPSNFPIIRSSLAILYFLSIIFASSVLLFLTPAFTGSYCLSPDELNRGVNPLLYPPTPRALEEAYENIGAL